MSVAISPTVTDVLLDIEGTTSSVRFVFEVMFPYARQHVGEYLKQHWGEPALRAALDKLAIDVGQTDAASWLSAFHGEQAQRDAVVAAVRQLMDRDAKVTGLKELQGLVWESGFRSGQMVAHLYPDVLSAVKAWKASGRKVWIYSSGSIAAQQLFFGHTSEGDLLQFFSGHFDTTSGERRKLRATSESPRRSVPSRSRFCSSVTSSTNCERLAKPVSRQR
jgi:enolase-phosphatase E1